MNVIASVLMLAGAALTLVAAIGVFRFPDVVSRLHAATKAASIGIALVLVGAGTALGAGPLAFLTLVAAFQVLTAPVAAHALGRAARPEYEPPLRHPAPSLPAGARITALAIVWVALWGQITAANVAGGLVVGTFITLLSGRRAAERFSIRPGPTVRFVAAFVVLMVRSTIAVAAAALGPRRLVEPTVRRVPLGPSSVPALVATANAVSLTPGTLTLAVDPDEPALVVHLLSPDAATVTAIGTLHDLAAAALPATPRPEEAHDVTSQ